jgi:Rieske Fe-S protein
MSESEGEEKKTLGIPRRRLLGWLSRGFLSLWAIGFGWVILAFLKPPRSRQSLGERVIKVGPLESIPVGQARLVRHGREPIFVVRTDERTVVGLSGVCTHLHCVLTWNEEQRQLVCPCHEGAFDLNGNVLKGPPPRPLERYLVQTQLGQVYLHF